MALIQSFSGVRGLYKADIDEITADKYCKAFLHFLNKNKIVVGCDTRPSSQSLKNKMIENIHHAIYVGISTTPMISLAVQSYKADGGIIITASHNEPEFNGFKFLGSDGALLRPDEMKKVIDNFKIGNVMVTDNYQVEDKSQDLKEKYADFVLKLIGQENIKLIQDSNFTLITDPNGGTAAVVLDEIFKRLNIKNIKKNYELGKFNRLIEPNKDSLKYLIPLIKENNADFAVGFDCDADRAEIVTEKGIVDGNYILTLLVDEVLSVKKGLIVTNDVTSYVVRDIINKYNAELKEVEVGEINVVDAMILNNAIVGGEGSSSGGILPESKGRDGILTICMILRLLAKRKKSINQIIDSYPRYYNERFNIKMENRDIIAVKKKIKEHFLSKGYEIQETGDESGGLKILTGKNSFLWFRASKTEPIFRIIADSNDKEEAKKLVELGKEVLDKAVFT